MRTLLLAALFSSSCFAADLAGNWVVEQPNNNDGTVRKTYFNLKQDGAKLTGTIRITQFFYTIVESTGGPDAFTVVAEMKDINGPRRVTYEIKLAGDELHVATKRNATSPLVEQIAHRAPDGAGALPARVALPALHKVKDNGLARTPPMGWNSWNKFAGRVSDSVVREIADAMVSSGMKEAGYVYINIDDTWEGGRDAQGNMLSNKKFPDMKALADYVHSKGLKLGIYSTPGPDTCAGYEGSHGHEEQDAKTFAAWGIDYLKYDWCGARTLYTPGEMQALYQKMGDALLASGRPIVYSLCQYGGQDVQKWGPEVGGNLWRTTGDIRDAWDSMTRIGFSQDALAPYAAPGHWNDPDMLEIGNGAMTDAEYRTHMTLWSMLAAPLIAGNDLRSMTPEIKAILMNKEVIAIDQDPKGEQARRVWKSGEANGQEIWTRSLADGGRALAIFNRSDTQAEVAVKWSDLGFAKPPAHARHIWAREDVQFEGPQWNAVVPAHGVLLLRLEK